MMRHAFLPMLLLAASNARVRAAAANAGRQVLVSMDPSHPIAQHDGMPEDRGFSEEVGVLETKPAYLVRETSGLHDAAPTAR